MRVRKANIIVLKIKFGHNLAGSQSQMVNTIMGYTIFIEHKRKLINPLKDTNTA